MEPFSFIHIAPPSAILSLWYFSRAWESHSLRERPQLSSILLLLFSSAFCYVIVYFIKLRPSVESLFTARRSRGRSVSVLHDEERPSSRDGLEEARPNRPNKWSIIMLVCAITTRIELFHFVKTQQQCSSFGHEYWLWPGLVVYQYISFRDTFQEATYGNKDDPWHSELHDWMTWLEGGRMRHLNHFIISCAFALAAGSAANQFASSSYMCLPSVDNPSLISYSQTGMVLLDITIAVLSWQQLVWGKSVKERIQSIANVLALSAFPIFIYDTLRPIWGSTGNASNNARLLLGFDIFLDSIALSVLLIAASLWICNTNLTGPVGTMTVFAGIWQTCATAQRYGDWDSLSRFSVLWPLFVATAAAVAFTHAQHLRTVATFRRGLFNWIVVLLALFATFRTLLAVIPVYDQRHPINQLIYDSEIDYRHWSVKVSTSKTSNTAARIYEDRHDGRKAPPLFKEWFAQLQRTRIRDSFPQIDEDLEPFWRVPPKQLRAAVQEAAQLPGVATLVIKDGQASIGRNDADGSRGQDGSLARLVQMASNFSVHLPDMILPINLGRSPRILPLWEKRWSIRRASDHGAEADVISGRSPRQAEISAAHEALGGQVVAVEGRRNSIPGNKNAMTAGEFRSMLRQACPPNSASRANPYWSSVGFCRPCAGAHSTLQLMSDWQTSLNSVCSQPDLAYLHGFYMTAPDVRPVQHLLPLFSLYKTAHFADILLPLSPGEALSARTEEVEGAGAAAAPDKPFLDRSDNISWSGSIGQNVITPEYLHGHHKLRLLGQLIKPRPTDKTTLIKPILEDTRQWVYAKRTTADVNSKLPLDVGISDYTACTGHNCAAVGLLFAGDDDRYRQAVGDGGTPRPPPAQVDNSKLTLLLDEDDGPAPGTLHALRTETVPILSTIFKTWYTSRLKPWVHFVPLDVRYQALHTTLSYFTVLEDRRDSGVMDSKGVAQQGKSWAKEVLRERDQEIYLFRLLIEWARLIDDERDDIGLDTSSPRAKAQPKKKD